MTFIRINPTQADAIRGSYGRWHALDPVLLPDSDDYILTDAVLAHPAFSDALDTLRSLPVYPAWQRNATYRVNGVVEYGDRLWRVKEEHVSRSDRTPPLETQRWSTAHPVDEKLVR